MLKRVFSLFTLLLLLTTSCSQSPEEKLSKAKSQLAEAEREYDNLMENPVYVSLTKKKNQLMVSVPYNMSGPGGIIEERRKYDERMDSLYRTADWKSLSEKIKSYDDKNSELSQRISFLETAVWALEEQLNY